MSILTLHIGSWSFAVAGYAEASARYAEKRDEQNLGARDMPEGLIFEGTNQIARVSYNAKVWPLEARTELTQPLYEPPATPQAKAIVATLGKAPADVLPATVLIMARDMAASCAAKMAAAQEGSKFEMNQGAVEELFRSAFEFGAMAAWAYAGVPRETSDLPIGLNSAQLQELQGFDVTIIGQDGGVRRRRVDLATTEHAGGVVSTAISSRAIDDPEG